MTPKKSSSVASSDRASAAAKIVLNPAGFKVCEGCDSIVGAAVVICPNCHSFRFDGTPVRVIEQATLLGSREQSSVTADDLAK